MESEHNLDWKQRFLVLVLLSVIIIVLLLTKSCEAKRDLEAQVNLYKTAQEELVTWKDKDSLNRGKIATLVADNLGAFAQLETSDSVIVHLKEVVKKYEKQLKKHGSVTVVHTQGNVEGTVPTVITVTDTTKCEPVYEAEYDFKGWVYGKVIASKDSVGISVTYREEMDIVIGEEKTGFLGFGKPKRFADVTLHNPYSEVEQMRVFEKVASRPKRFAVGPGIHYGVGSGFTPEVFVGIGIQYTLFRL